ncbi:uncharacterized protein LOC143681117 [Tamandua tetradactyla]|uniref:uncharacterized protein LOC143681117 n=1 Tax=Tamandua tetradactyla TaxID=48850 RepID=UPI004053F499
MWELGPLILLWSVVGLFVLWLHCRQRQEMFQGVEKHRDSSGCQCRDPEMEREGGLRAWRDCQGGSMRTWDQSPPQKRDEDINCRSVQACCLLPPATPAQPVGLHPIRRATAIRPSRLAVTHMTVVI